jgi:hypothetical protein
MRAQRHSSGERSAQRSAMGRAAAVAVTLALAGSACARAQSAIVEPYTETSARDVAVTLRGGVTLATPRGDFPSLIVGDSSKRGTGAIGEQYGRSEVGSRFDMVMLVPIDRRFGVSVGFGSQRVAIGYDADTTRFATRFEVQTLQATVGAQWSFVDEELSYQYGGLRSVYVDAGLDIGVATLADRVESTSYGDTLGATRSPIAGSFDNNEPFRTTVAVRGALGLRFAATPHIELMAESWYSLALNRFFSSDALENNDLAIDVTGIALGIGYRF